MRVLDSLLDRLSDALPLDFRLRVYHLSTWPTPCSPLFSPPPEKAEEQTLCQNHFLGIAVPGSGDKPDQVLLYALEVFVYSTNSRTVIFVSKADSSGFLDLARPPGSHPSIVRTITTCFLHLLVLAYSKITPVILSLFARSQNQYLFPGSIENAGKHLLDDRQLIKWWCRIFDSVIRDEAASAESLSTPKAYLVVPGCDRAETLTFFPPTARQDPSKNETWINAYPLAHLFPDPSAPMRSLIPRFPDDPKARFLDDLDAREMDRAGNWRSIKSLAQFWEMMSYRQECSAGRLVGFLWATFEVQGDIPGETNGVTGEKQPSDASDANEPSLPTPVQSQINKENGNLSTDPAKETTTRSIPILNTPPSSSPVPSSLHISRPVNVDGEIRLDDDKYQTLMDHLLDLDFGGEEAARSSTTSWIAKVADLAAVSSWGRTIVGRRAKAPGPSPFTAGRQETSQPLPPPPPTINILTGIRKKRKAPEVTEIEGRTENQQRPSDSDKTVPAVNTLDAGLIRKKPKT